MIQTLQERLDARAAEQLQRDINDLDFRISRLVDMFNHSDARSNSYKLKGQLFKLIEEHALPSYIDKETAVFVKAVEQAREVLES